jgi:hypothetical protein
MRWHDWMWFPVYIAVVGTAIGVYYAVTVPTPRPTECEKSCPIPGVYDDYWHTLQRHYLGNR